MNVIKKIKEVFEDFWDQMLWALAIGAFYDVAIGEPTAVVCTWMFPLVLR